MARGRPLLKSPVQAKAEDQQLHFLPPKDAEYVRDWTMLAAREEVYIVQENDGELSGRVDAVTEDGTILWMHLAGGPGGDYLPDRKAVTFGASLLRLKTLTKNPSPG